MNIERKYIVDEHNRRIAVQLDIKTFERMEQALEDFALAQLMQVSTEDEESIDLDEALSYYENLEKAK